MRTLAQWSGCSSHLHTERWALKHEPYKDRQAFDFSRKPEKSTNYSSQKEGMCVCVWNIQQVRRGQKCLFSGRQAFQAQSTYPALQTESSEGEEGPSNPDSPTQSVRIHTEDRWSVRPRCPRPFSGRNTRIRTPSLAFHITPAILSSVLSKRPRSIKPALFI